MAAKQDPPSFDAIIQAGRERKKAEILAQEIFSKGRKTSSPQLGGHAKPNSLANRITKPGQRSNPASPILRAKLQSAVNRDARRASEGQGARRNPFNAGNPSSQGKPQNGNTTDAKEFSIRGAAGPYVVVGSNFAPGTTGADIQSAMEAITGEMLACNIITPYPTVIAEMVFADKACAETVVETFNNQKADGRLLHVYHKNGPPTQMPEPTPTPPPVVQPQPVQIPLQTQTPRELLQERSSDYRSRSTNDRRASPEFQDGRYGFESKEDEMEVEVQDQTPAPQPEPVPEPSREPPRSGPRSERSDQRYDSERRERYGYRQGYSRDTRPDRRDYGNRDNRDSRYHNGYGNGNHRPSQPSRLYSDEMYGYRGARGHGYR